MEDGNVGGANDAVTAGPEATFSWENVAAYEFPPIRGKVIRNGRSILKDGVSP